MAKLAQYTVSALLIFFVLQLHAQTQKQCRLVIYPSTNATIIPADVRIPAAFDSKEKCLTYIKQLPNELMTKGYISASIDSLWEDSVAVYLKLFTGKKYVWTHLSVDENNWQLLSQFGYNSATFNNKPFDQQKVTTLYNQLLDYYAVNGYPFASVGLDSISINENSVSAKLVINEGSLYHIDTVIVTGDVKISKDFLERYLDIKEHDVYDQEKINKINTRIAELPFISQSQPYRISLLNTGAEINLFLQNRRSNQVNVLIGFLPANQQLGGKLLVTGEANLNLRNPFGNGETLGINWQQLQSKSPQLNLLFQRPYLFHSPFGVNFNFDLYKRDSFYLNIHSLVGAQYNASTKKTLFLSLQFARTNLLSVDTNVVKATKRLPDIIDLSTTGLSFEYDYNNTNYRFNPRTGNEMEFTVGFGKKNIRRNNTILSIKDPLFNYGSLYDTVQQKSYQFKTTINAAHYFPVGKQSTFKTGLQGGWLQTPNYYLNELFQIGGFKTLRGFDEESIYTNRFLVATLEYRYLLAQNSWFFVFTDIGRAAFENSVTNFAHNYYGAGTGIAFETNSGIFNISWAVGKRNDLNLDLRQSKIHIGFVSLF